MVRSEWCSQQNRPTWSTRSKGEEVEEDLDLSALSDEDLVEQMQADPYDGLAGEIRERWTVLAVHPLASPLELVLAL